MYCLSKMIVKSFLACDIRWFICIFWTLLATVLSAEQQLKNTTSTSPLHCSNVRHALQHERNFGEIPREPISGEALKVCSIPQAVQQREEGESVTSGVTCCTARMEAALAARARQDFDQSLENALQGKLSVVLRARATKFDEFFRELLATSKHEFHEMFKKTYGVIYEQNSYVFTELFDELERYYVKGRVRLDHAMEAFFARLYQKMFTVLNGQYHFDEKYLNCVGEHMKDLRPFGDVPHKLSVQVKRSFVATRTFGQALTVAADVASTMRGLRPPPECGRALARMSGCNVCQGRPNLKACPSFCANVMRGCLAYHSELNTEWNAFVDAFVQVSARLLGPFNIEVVVEPINIKISEAIMNFQENGHEVSQKVFSGCGRPRLGKRSNPATELHFETLNFGRNNNRQRGSMHSEQTPLEKLISDTSYKINDTKNFWSLLPLQMCNNDEVAAKQENNCWNGHQKAKYTQLLINGTGMAAQASNPEVHVDSFDSSHISSLLNEQMYALRMMASKLRSAYNGKDVEWEDEEDDEDSALDRGSGSGYGSGDYSTASPGEGRHRDNGPEDLEPGGSGDGDDEDYPRPPSHSHPVQPLPPLQPKETYPSSAPPSSSSAPPHHRAKPSKLEVTRAVATYLFPIVVVWFGGMFSEW